jgi:2-keto-3-deoxy-galactonokinase
MTEAVGCIMGMVPLYLSKARRLLFHKKLSQVATISSSASAALFREITGDQTLADGDEKKKREAYVEEFVMLVGDPEVLSDLVLDMRAHSNAQRLGKTAYQDFWDCALKILDMMQTEAEQRRHGGIVVFASEVISQNAFYKQVCDRFDIEQQAVPPRIGVEATSRGCSRAQGRARRRRHCYGRA